MGKLKARLVVQRKGEQQQHEIVQTTEIESLRNLVRQVFNL
jgi:hypothetical protein